MREIKLRKGKDEVTSYPEDMYICYHHVDPETLDVVYVGEGRIDRAYQITHRTEAHHRWLVDKLEKFDIQEIVRIKGGNMTKEEALVVERHEIKCCLRKGCNLYNIEKNPYRRARTEDERNKRLPTRNAEDSQPESGKIN